MGARGDLGHHPHRDLELGEQHVPVGELRLHVAQVGVGTGDHDDHVLGVAVRHGDPRLPGRLAGHRRHARDVDAPLPQPAEVRPSGVVVAHGSDHGHLRARLGGRHRLVGPLAPGVPAQVIVGQDRLPGARVALDDRDEVDVERAQHHDPTHQRMPPVTVSSHRVA